MKKALFTVPILICCTFAKDFNPQMQEYINSLKAEAKKIDSSFKDFDAKRGEKVFLLERVGKKGQNISCSSCHTFDLNKNGKNIFTNKTIKPLSPKQEASRLTNVKDVKKWLRRNFQDVYVREGTALEKGDVLYFINQ